MFEPDVKEEMPEQAQADVIKHVIHFLDESNVGV